MIKQIISLASLFIIGLNINAQHLENFNLSEEDFLSNYKYDSTSTYHEETNYHVYDTIYGISDEWTYRFEDSKLQFHIFSHYSYEIDEKNFVLNLNAAENLIADFTKFYGEPDSFEIGDSTFVDPYEKRHWGYDVIKAKWETKGMKIKIEFQFFGGKGEYFYLFSVKFFDEDYPYFN